MEGGTRMLGPGRTTNRAELSLGGQGSLFDSLSTSSEASVKSDTPSLDGCFVLRPATQNGEGAHTDNDRSLSEHKLSKLDERTQKSTAHLISGSLETYRFITYVVCSALAEIEKQLTQHKSNGDNEHSKPLFRRVRNLEKLNHELYELCHFQGEFVSPSPSQLSGLNNFVNALPLEKEFFERRLYCLKCTGGLKATLESDSESLQKQMLQNPNLLNPNFYAVHLANLEQTSEPKPIRSPFDADRQLVLEQINLLSAAKRFSPRILVGSLMAGLGEYGSVYQTAVNSGQLAALEYVAEKLMAFRLDHFSPAQDKDTEKLFLQRIYKCPSIATFRPDHIGQFFRTLAQDSPYEALTKPVHLHGHHYLPRWSDVAARIIPESDPKREEVIRQTHTAHYVEDKYKWFVEIKNRLFEQGQEHFAAVNRASPN
jgi:hypothetical protein